MVWPCSLVNMWYVFVFASPAWHFHCGTIFFILHINISCEVWLFIGYIFLLFCLFIWYFWLQCLRRIFLINEGLWLYGSIPNNVVVDFYVLIVIENAEAIKHDFTTEKGCFLVTVRNAADDVFFSNFLRSR